MSENKTETRGNDLHDRSENRFFRAARLDRTIVFEDNRWTFRLPLKKTYRLNLDEPNGDPKLGEPRPVVADVHAKKS